MGHDAVAAGHAGSDQGRVILRRDSARFVASVFSIFQLRMYLTLLYGDV
jgi:hypothetical protein